MARTLISFLGNIRKTADRPKGYDLATYSYQNRHYRTCFVAEALVSIYQPEKLYVVVTPDAYNNHYSDLVDALSDVPISIFPIHIMNPTDTDDYIWDIFNKITDVNVIENNDSIIFDVTLSFRPIPILAFLASSYLQKVRNITLEALVYGEYVLGQPLSYIRDLTTFAQLLDWTTAVSTFMQTGRAENLTELASKLGGTATAQFAQQLQTLSQELLSTRPVGTMWAASQLQPLISDVQSEQRPESQPLALLLEQIDQEYGMFRVGQQALPDLKDAYQQAHRKDEKFLEMQLAMIKWYTDKGLAIQALTLAREWLISLADFYQDAAENTFTYKKRDQISRYIGSHSPKRKTPKETPFEPNTRLKRNVSAIADVWESIRMVRNDIAHCGMDEANAREAAIIQQSVEAVYEQLHTFLSNKS